MKINEQDIIHTVRQLCDEQNEQLHICPWQHHHHFHIPGWLVAIPAAVFVGFFLGLWTSSHTQETIPLTALVDTVYIQIHDTPAITDTAMQVNSPRLSPETKRPKTAKKRQARPNLTGHPVADDQIRYDLLVLN